VGSDEALKVEGTLHVNKPYVLLPALSLVAILNGQKDLGIAGAGGVVNTISLRVVKGVDDKVSKIHPSLVKISVPIAQNSFNGRARIKLSAECVDHQSQISGKVLEGGIIHLEGMCALVDGHRGSNLWVQLDGHAADRHIAQIEGGRAHFVDHARVLGGRHREVENCKSAAEPSRARVMGKIG
jgi:hypothetical protein